MDRVIAAQVFTEIAARGSLSATADALAMSRPMVTRYLAEMEKWAGARLLHRTTRRVTLTPAGEDTLPRCRHLLEVAGEMALTSPETNQAPRGLLRVACSQSLAQNVLARAVAEFLRLHPQVSVDLQVGARAVNLVEDRIDLAIRITNDIDPNLIARPFANCASVICASPTWVVEHGAPSHTDDLADQNCLTYSHFGKSQWEFTCAGEPTSVTVSGNLTANEPQVLLAAALEDVGITMQPRYAVDKLIAQGRLIHLLPEYEPQRLGVHGIFLSRRQMSPALRALIEFLASWFETLTPWSPRPQVRDNLKLLSKHPSPNSKKR